MKVLKDVTVQMCKTPLDSKDYAKLNEIYNSITQSLVIKT